ncbi:MAG: Gfo/Idh/MocA family oxidoreductase, partial [Kiritimatiellia bacterium]|nr:Gfo/Idh/MocA family oxidoreductase [Kiritimatiellia bacterium]
MNIPPDRPVTAIIVGAGHRAAGVYATYALAHPDKLRIVGVADPLEVRRKQTAAQYGLKREQCYHDAAELASKGKIADAIINGTMDAEHVPTTLPLLACGYDVLLEKPFAVTEEEVFQLARAVRQTRRKVMICHVLRYAPFYVEVQKKIASGELGQIVNIQATEHVSYHHMATAFVRGKWGNQEACGSPIILSKCCHDMDLLTWLKSGVTPTRVASFGSRMFFRPENAPKGAGTRCLVDCPIEADCLYSAKRHFVDMELWKFYAWSDLEHIENPTLRDKLAELKRPDNPMGRCVWKCDNTVC